MQKITNNLARAVIIHDEHILLAKSIQEDGEGHWFLPGGHVEYNESVVETLQREFKEEVGRMVEVRKFLGVFEQRWGNQGEPYHEINFVFEAGLENINVNSAPKSLESHIAFEWIKLSDLANINLLPQYFVTLIPKWLDGKAPHFVSTMLSNPTML